MEELNNQLFELIILLNNNKIKDINHINRLGHVVLKSKNHLYIQSFLANVSWNEIDEKLLIELVADVIVNSNKQLIASIIRKLYALQKYDVIENAYHLNDSNELIDEIIVNNARNFITSNYHSEDVYDEFLDAKVFLGLLCDKEANQDNIERSFELVKHIKPKKIYKKA